MSVDKRFLIAWAVLAAVAILSICATRLVLPLAEFSAIWIPSIAALKSENIDVYAYFGTSVLLMLPLAIFILAENGSNRRLREFIKKSSRPISQVLFMYAAALPVSILLFFILAFLPITSMTKSGYGGKIAQWILTSDIGLVVGGSFLTASLTGILTLILGLLVFPFVQIFERKICAI